jgi:hypothetical protein
LALEVPDCWREPHRALPFRTEDCPWPRTWPVQPLRLLLGFRMSITRTLCGWCQSERESAVPTPQSSLETNDDSGSDDDEVRRRFAKLPVWKFGWLSVTHGHGQPVQFATPSRLPRRVQNGRLKRPFSIGRHVTYVPIGRSGTAGVASVVRPSAIEINSSARRTRATTKAAN